jgi:hypothetical protein
MHETGIPLERWALKKAGVPFVVRETTNESDEDDAFSRIRCPLCHWQPSASSVWACQSFGTPEPFFGGCGTMWNTFATRGKCPGCAHQWLWTSCPHCIGWSLHEDWYESA